MSKEKVPFYKKPFVIILLFIFLPFVGIPLWFKFSKKPSRKTKIIISTVWSVLWIGTVIAVQLDSYRTYTVDGRSVTITCSSYCSYIDGYGDKDALKIIATIGVRDITYAPDTLDNNKAVLDIKASSKDADQLTIEYKDSRLLKVYNTDYPTVIYYSSSSDDKVVSYPAINEIKNIQAAKKRAEGAAKAKQESEKVPQIKDTSSNEVDWVSLKDNAENNIKSILKAPSTAKFPGSFWDPFEGWQRGKTGNIVSLSSYVDSENSFSAMIRSYFTIKYKDIGASYRPVYVEFDGKVLKNEL